MIKSFLGRILAAGAAPLAVGLAAAPASADTYIYNYYGEPGTTMQYNAPAPRYDSAPLYTAPSNTTYFYGSSTSPYAPPSSSYYYSPPSAYYVPPGLSITTPLGTYAPFYGGYSSYGASDPYDPYRSTPGY